MPIDRAWWNALVDDTGTGTTGTIWNKAAIAGLLDAIDGCFAVNQVWTPSITFGGSGAGITYGTRIGQWSRADQIIVCEFHMSLTSKGTATGTAALTGFPVPEKFPNTAICHLDPAVGMSPPGPPFGVLAGGVAYLLYMLPNSTRGQLTDAHFAANADLRGTIVYRRT